MPKIPVVPPLLESPIAISGDRQSIPNTTTVLGKMSLAQGFPQECSRELADGGIAPARTDMNEALYLLSTWAFFAQSGGLVSWTHQVNYVKPALVFHGETLYTCTKNNGPDISGVGVRTPGQPGSELYWIPGFGGITSNLYGNNANNYTKTGVYWIDDAFASYGFPVAGVGGFLAINNKGNVIDQGMTLRTDSTKLYKRSSVNNAATYLAWTKSLFANDVRGAAYREIYMATTKPIDAVGLDGDVHFQYI